MDEAVYALRNFYIVQFLHGSKPACFTCVLTRLEYLIKCLKHVSANKYRIYFNKLCVDFAIKRESS